MKPFPLVVLYNIVRPNTNAKVSLAGTSAAPVGRGIDLVWLGAALGQ